MTRYEADMTAVELLKNHDYVAIRVTADGAKVVTFKTEKQAMGYAKRWNNENCEELVVYAYNQDIAIYNSLEGVEEEMEAKIAAQEAAKAVETTEDDSYYVAIETKLTSTATANYGKSFDTLEEAKRYFTLKTKELFNDGSDFHIAITLGPVVLLQTDTEIEHSLINGELMRYRIWNAEETERREVVAPAGCLKDYELADRVSRFPWEATNIVRYFCKLRELVMTAHEAQTLATPDDEEEPENTVVDSKWGLHGEYGAVGSYEWEEELRCMPGGALDDTYEVWRRHCGTTQGCFWTDWEFVTHCTKEEWSQMN